MQRSCSEQCTDRNRSISRIPILLVTDLSCLDPWLSCFALFRVRLQRLGDPPRKIEFGAYLNYWLNRATNALAEFRACQMAVDKVFSRAGASCRAARVCGFDNSQRNTIAIGTIVGTRVIRT